MRPRGHALLACVLWASAGAQSHARAQERQDRRTSEPERLPPARSELVQLDAVVSGKDGRPMADLAAADFQVLEDGRPQRLTHFALVRRPAAVPAPAPSAAPPGTSPTHPEETPAATEARLFVLVVDDLDTAPGNAAAARKALSRFVDEQLSDGDFVALVTTGASSAVQQDFTRDRQQLHRAIAHVEGRYQPVEPGGTPYLSEYQAELIDQGDVDALRLAVQEVLQTEDYLGEIGAREQTYAQARRMVFEIMARTGRTLQAIESVVRNLAPLPGRKAVVLLSDGFLVGLGAPENRAFDVRRIVDAATRSGVVLYALDTRGVVADVPGGSASFSGPGVLTAPGVRGSLQARASEAQRQGMNALAEDTGGFLVRETNDLVAGFGRILRDTEAYYLLAYEPENVLRDGRFRRIEVKVTTRPGLRVRTRAGYFAADERHEATAEDKQQRRERELAQALASPFPLSAVPTRLVADYIDLPPAGPQAVIRARIDVSGVPFTPTGDRFLADLEIVGAVHDENGQAVGEVSGEHAQLSLTEESYSRALREGLTLQRTVPLRPGRYQVRMAVREGTLALLGSVSQWLEIPDTAARPLTLSSVFLLADDGPGTTDLTDVQVDRQLRAGQGLHYVVQVYGSAAAITAATLQAQVWRGTHLVGVTPKHALEPTPPADAASQAAGTPPAVAAAKWSERIALSGFERGEYELRVIVSGSDGKPAAQRRVGFRVD